jgi:hypothetical protein
MRPRKFFAGPWVGEFGWELFCWQGYLRQMTADADEVIVMSRPNMEYLYADFCTSFIPVDVGNVTDCEKCAGFVYDDRHKEFPEHTWINPFKRIARWEAGVPILEKQKFVQYGFKREGGFDIVIHARKTNKFRSDGRNWSQASWKQLISELSPKFRIACTGSASGAHAFEGTTDFRGQTMSEDANMIASAGVIVGPSSGPMHLGSLCGTQQLVWSEPKNRVRYERLWNPFKTAVTFIDTWQPTVPQVMSALATIGFKLT